MIYDITPFSTLDFPGRLSAIIWLAGCNMRCKYCYNPQIVHAGGSAAGAGVSLEHAQEFLLARARLLDGVVFSGGECSLSSELYTLAEFAKSLNYAIKIDSNASNPKALKRLIDSGLIDYAALDFKAIKSKFSDICQVDFYDEFWQSFELLQSHQIPFEVRTTWHFDLLSKEDILRMHALLKERGYSGRYALQGFLHAPNLGGLGPARRHYSLDDLPSEDFELRNFG